MDLDYYLGKLKKAIRGRAVIFIDAANLEQSVRHMGVNPKDIPDHLRKYHIDQLCWRVDYQQFHNFFRNLCNLRDTRFYSPNFRTDSHNKFLGFLKQALQFNLGTKFLKEYGDHTPEQPHRKANFDVEIAVDATYRLQEYDTFILFSGDSDFEYLLRFLRGQNKIVIVFSRSGHIAKELPPASSHYFDVADFRHHILRVNVRADFQAQRAPL